jgi:hypothetical protein
MATAIGSSNRRVASGAGGVAPRLLLADRLSHKGIVVPVVISNLSPGLDEDWNWAIWRLLQATQAPTIVVGSFHTFGENFERLVMTDWNFKEIPVSVYVPDNPLDSRIVTKSLGDSVDDLGSISLSK